MDMNEMANWFRLYSIFNHGESYGPYDWPKRKLRLSFHHTLRYYDTKSCQIINPIDKDETLEDRREKYKQSIDIYKDSWYGLPPSYSDLRLSEDR
jgi:hypothetical protein